MSVPSPDLSSDIARFSPSAVFAPDLDVLVHPVEGEVVLLHIGTENYFGLDGVGSLVWDSVCSGLRLQDVVTSVVSEFEVARNVAERDVALLLGELVDASLVRLVAA